MTRGKHRYHPYAGSRLERRVRAHFTSGHVESTMTDVNMTSEANKKRKHEAHIIPGLGPLQYGMPNSIITKLRYCEPLTIVSTSGATNYNIFRANGITDPDYTNAGHQPLYRDAFAQFYDYYTVLGSRINVTFLSRSATAGFYVGIQGSDTASPSTAVSTWMEQNNGVHDLIGNISSGSRKLFMTFGSQENQGVDTEDDLSSLIAVGSDPGSAAAYYFTVLASSEDNSTATVAIMVEIEYTVKFTTLSKRVSD